MSVATFFNRPFAMADQCRNKGGDCPCRGECEAEVALCLAEFNLRQQLDKVESKLRWLRHRPCTVRTDWQKPEPPPGDYRLAVHLDGRDWLLHWYGPDEANDCIDITGDAAWPFVEDEAWAEDWEALGIEVV